MNDFSSFGLSQVRPHFEMSPVQVLILAVMFLLCAENVDVTWVPCPEFFFERLPGKFAHVPLFLFPFVCFLFLG